MVSLEDKFIDLAFEQGGVEGIEPNQIKQYIRHIADRRLLQLGLKPNFAVKDNPLPWLDWVLNGVEHTNFFENRATEYAKGSMTGNLWG
jgi:ribonucleoside-diphosphate reductase beta chain